MNIIKLFIKTLLATVITFKPVFTNEIWKFKEKINNHEVILFNYDKINKEDASNLINLIDNFNKDLKAVCCSSFLSQNRDNAKLEIIDFSARYRLLYEYNKNNIYQVLLPMILAKNKAKVINPTTTQDITLLNFCIINIENYINKNIINEDLAIYFYIASDILHRKNDEYLAESLNTTAIHIRNKAIIFRKDPIDFLKEQLEIIKSSISKFKKNINKELFDWIKKEQVNYNIIIFHSKEDAGFDIEPNNSWNSIYKHDSIGSKEYKALLSSLVRTNKPILN